MPAPSAPHMASREWLLLVCLSVLWGGSFLFAEIALVDLPPLTIVLGRVGLAALALLCMLALAGQLRYLAPRRWPQFAAMGLLNNVIPFGLIVWGQTAIEGGLASILNATTPLFTVLLAHWLTRDERLTPGRMAGVLCGTAGVAVLTGVDLLQNLGTDLWAQAAVLGGALSYACAGIYGRRFADLPPLATATGQVMASTCLLLPLVAIVDRPWALVTPSPATLGAVAGMAILCTALAYILYFRILAVAGATNLLLVTLLIPLSAVGLGALVLGERLELHQGTGAVLIALALVAVDGRALKRWLGRKGPRPHAVRRKPTTNPRETDPKSANR